MGIAAPIHGSALVLVLARALHADLLAVVDEGVARHEQAQTVGHLGDRTFVEREEARVPCRIVVRVERRIDIAGVGLAVRRVRALHGLHVVRCRVAAVHDIADDALGVREREVEERVDAARVEARDGRAVRPSLPHQVAVGFDGLAGIRQEPQELGVAVGVAGHIGGHGIQAEAVHPLVQPILHDAADLSARLLVSKIEVGHLRPEARLVVPRRSLQRDEAVQLLAGEGVVPDVRAFLPDGILVRREALQVLHRRDEPRMRIGGVVEHQVQQDADAALMAFRQQRLVILHRPEGGIDGVVVIHVVLVVGGRRVHGGQPELVEAHARDIVQLAADPVQIADPVPVRVAERVREDLVGSPEEIVADDRFQVLVEGDHLNGGAGGCPLAARAPHGALDGGQQRAQTQEVPPCEVFHDRPPYHRALHCICDTGNPPSDLYRCPADCHARSKPEACDDDQPFTAPDMPST